MSADTDSLVHHHAHHFNSAEEEFAAAKQGMWLFLVTEVLMIGSLFVLYSLFRGLYPEMFHEAHKLLNVKMGATNTVILITSSVTMVLAVQAAQRGQRDRSKGFIAATFLLGCGFLVVKAFEYHHKFVDGLLPGGLFTNTELVHPKSSLFFSLYFMMTGLHAFHVIIGMGLMIWLYKRTANKEFNPEYYTPIELFGFYWHFVDLVWIYLFPLLYLVS